MAPRLVLGFVLAVLPLIATPGASFALLTRHVAVGGPPAGLPVIAGTVTGLYAHAALATAGLSALVMHASWALTTLRLVGAVYLIVLGVRTWRSPGGASASVRGRGRGPYVQALLGNVLNPKAALIFLTLVPQFVEPHNRLWPQVLILVTAQAALIAVWLGGWSLLIGRARTASRRTQALRRLAAVALVVLGVRTATG
jgi:threonine/homoserine/homoserine lactone efflux protein